MRRTILLSALPIVLLLGCNMGDAHARDRSDSPQGRGSGAAVRDFRLSGFDRVTLRGSDDVTVAIGPAFAVHATGDAAALDALEISVTGGTLRIGRKSSAGWTMAGHRHAVVAVTLPRLRGAAVAGSGAMTVGPVRAPAFEGNVSGSGNLRLAEIGADRVSLGIAGSGNIDAAGSAHAGSFSLVGSGDLRAGRLMTGTAAANATGSGNMAISARQTANVALTGSGDVTVGGGAHCTIAKTGSGNVRCG